jgi:SAM-dependent methyltransferase
MNYLKTIYGNRPYTPYPSKLAKYLYARFNMKCNRKEVLLDIGCGRGEYLKEFDKLNVVAWGIDREHNNNISNILIRNVEKEKIPFDNCSLDYIFSKSLIEHLYDPYNFMKECYRVLKKGGVLIIMTPDWNKQSSVFYDDPTHVHPYSKESIRDLLKMHGFKDVKSEIFYHYPASWKFPILKKIRLSLPIKFAKWLTRILKIGYFRWINDSTILGVGIK